MPFRELRGKNDRAFYDIRVQQLTAAYRSAQDELKRIISSADSTDFQVARANQLMTETRAIVRELDIKARRWATRNIAESYKRGMEFAGERLKAMDVAKRVDIGAQIHVSAVNVVADQMTLDLLNANASMLRSVTDYLRRTQQKFIEESEINKNIVKGLIEGESRRTTSDRLYQDLKKRMNGEQFVKISGRNFEPKQYAQLVARTRTREATTKGTINSSLRYGVDLVQVSVHEGPCEVCVQFQGKIYSISGTSKDFPALKVEPPFHPNCKHVLLPVTVESLKIRDSFDTLKSFSRSKREVEDFAAFEELVEA